MTIVWIRRADGVHDIAGAVVEAHRRVLLELVPGAEVEHVGATAVPGALTKGDVDVLVRVGEPEFPAAVEALSHRYAIHQAHNWTPALASFADPDGADPPVGIQLVVRGSEPDRFFGPFRDALIGSDAPAGRVQRAEAPPGWPGVRALNRAEGAIHRACPERAEPSFAFGRVTRRNCARCVPRSTRQV